MNDNNLRTSIYLNRLLVFVIVFGVWTFAPAVVFAGLVNKPAIPKIEITANETPKIELTPITSSKKTTLPLTPLFASPTEQRDTITTYIDIPATYQDWKSQGAGQNSTTIQEPKFIEKDGRVVDFSPGGNQYIFDPVDSLIQTISEQSLVAVSSFAYINKNTPLSQTNTFGINELLARGVSNFAGSSKNRRTNIKVAVEKIRGVLVAPGKSFSFNDNVGDVSAEDGFVPEIVIKKDGLKPELGGGVCQVSSTIFRAAMASGMPITERKNHSFPVNHYAPQGTDATTYTGVIDLKFQNDTPGHILLWPYFTDNDTLIFDIYGTDDGRIVKVDAPVKYGFQSNGIYKTKWERTVSLPGQEIRKDNLGSTYLPASWFKKEETFVTAPAPSTETPKTETEQTTGQTQVNGESTTTPTPPPPATPPPPIESPQAN